jgi:hypothetical protein
VPIAKGSITWVCQPWRRRAYPLPPRPRTRATDFKYRKKLPEKPSAQVNGSRLDRTFNSGDGETRNANDTKPSPRANTSHTGSA